MSFALCGQEIGKSDDTVQPIGGSYLTDFDGILNGQNISNRLAVFEQMTSSLLHVLCTLDTGEETAWLLSEVLDKNALLLESLDGIADQYYARKVHRHNHNKAFEKAKEGLLKCVQAMLKRDRNADAEWTVIPRSLLPIPLTIRAEMVEDTELESRKHG